MTLVSNLTYDPFGPERTADFDPAGLDLDLSRDYDPAGQLTNLVVKKARARLRLRQRRPADQPRRRGRQPASRTHGANTESFTIHGGSNQVTAHDGVWVWNDAAGRLTRRWQAGIAHCESVQDYVSRNLFREILDGEEEQIDWLETRIELIGKVGLENCLQSQMGSAE